jgi:hypothetical protein
VDTSRQQNWIPAALFVGFVYALVGRLFALPTDHAHFWRLAAWLVSGVAFATHITYEHIRLGHRPGVLALHAAIAVALGAFGLAVAGALHSFWATSSIRPLWLLALVAWPAFTAVPAFLVAFIAGAILTRVVR